MKLAQLKQGKGSYFLLDAQQQGNAFLEAKAASDFLANQEGVDASRIGVFGTVMRAKHGGGGAVEDSWVKTLIWVSFYEPSPEAKENISQKWNMPVLCMASRGEPAAPETPQVCERSKNPESEPMLFPGGGYGSYQIPGSPAPALEWLVEEFTQR